MDKLTMQITGMTCGHCVATVTRAVRAADPAADVKVDLARLEGQQTLVPWDRQQIEWALIKMRPIGEALARIERAGRVEQQQATGAELGQRGRTVD